MATTLATEKQAEAIKQRMAEIRTELPYSADVARHRVRQLTDWKYHMARHPLPILAATAVAGFLLVPAKSSHQRVVIHRDDAAQPISQPAKKGLLGGIMGVVATIAVKQATSLASSQLTKVLSNRDTA